MNTIDYKVKKDYWGNLLLYVKNQSNKDYVLVYQGVSDHDRNHQLNNIKRVLGNIYDHKGETTTDVYERRVYL